MTIASTSQSPRVAPASSSCEVLPASQFDIETLARLYTCTFEGYYYPAVITPEMLSTFIRVEDLDLHLSPVLRVGSDLVGFATVGLRGSSAYCRGFGIVPEHRGQGLANVLCDAMLHQARSANASNMCLGVLLENVGAVNTYVRGGFRPVRELHSVEWKKNGDVPIGEFSNVQALEPSRALAQFDALHSIPTLWNRDVPSLKQMEGLQGRAILKNGIPTAYVLFSTTGDSLEIQDVAAVHPSDAVHLLRHLQVTASRIVCYNEPEASPMHRAFRACDFVITQRRYEMIAEV